MSDEYTQPFVAQQQFNSEAQKKISNSAVSVVAVTVGDPAFEYPCRALWIGTRGDLVLHFPDSTSATFVGMEPGLYPFAIIRVTTAGATDASDIVALF